MSVFLSAIVLFFNKYISNSILKNNDIVSSVLFLSPAILIISMSSVIRGYFYGLKKISPAGISQIIEQVTRIVFVIGLIYYLSPVNSKTGAFIAVCGISVGELFGLLWLVFHYQLLKSKKVSSISKNKINFLTILSQISYIAVPITISRIINVLLQLANAILIPQRLMIAGYSNKEAIAIFGRVVGMSMPIIFLPFIVTTVIICK